MKVFLKCAGPVGLALLLGACSTSGSMSVPGEQQQTSAHRTAGVGRIPDGITLGRHEMPIYTGRAGRSLGGRLPYNGGKVQVGPKIYVVYWGWAAFGDPVNVKPALDGFLRGAGGSKWLSTVTQYYDGAGHIKNSKGEFGGAFADDKNGVPDNPTDAQVQAEAQALVDHFGADPNASYIVATPHGRSTNGFGTQWCAYHGSFTYQNTVIAYTNLPYMPDAGPACGAGFVNTPGTLDGVSIVAGHEIAETQTDPNPPTGWSGSDGEVGDICAWSSKTADQPLSGSKYPVQPLWSDKAASCTMKGPSGP